MATLNSGQHLKALIAQAGHTLTDIAPKIGYTREHLSRLINAGHVDELLVWKVSNAIGVDLVSVMFPAKKDHERDVSCEEERNMLKAELEEARKTIRDLSATLRALTSKN